MGNVINKVSSRRDETFVWQDVYDFCKICQWRFVKEFTNVVYFSKYEDNGDMKFISVNNNRQAEIQEKTLQIVLRRLGTTLQEFKMTIRKGK